MDRIKRYCQCIWGSRELDPLGQFLMQQYQNQNENNRIPQLIITFIPENLRQNYNRNRNILKRQGILNIDQLAQSQGICRMIMTETEAEQFQLAYNYRDRQNQNPFSMFPYGNTGYTFKFENQNRLNQGRNVLVIGERNSGKSTLINALGNSLIIDYPDRYRYHFCDYDSNQMIQECDIDLQNVQFKFLEVQGYGYNQQDNLNILLETYNHLEQNAINIDCILICRRSSNQILNSQEKQIFSHLAELFGLNYISRCFLVNTRYDLGNIIDNLIIIGLQDFNNIYNLMPNPKILFVNSITTPFEGNIGNLRFQTVITVRDAINNLINLNNIQIPFINREAFNNRREQEGNLAQIKNQLKGRLFALLPCLENYFQIYEVDSSDRLFYVSQIIWSSIENGALQRQNQQLERVLQRIILPDQLMQTLQQIDFGTIDIQRQEDKRKERVLKEQFNQLKNELNEDKNSRLNNIQMLANEYINENQIYLEGTYADNNQETRETIIDQLMNIQLRLFLQTNQGYERVESIKEIQAIRQMFHLQIQDLTNNY